MEDSATLSQDITWRDTAALVWVLGVVILSTLRERASWSRVGCSLAPATLVHRFPSTLLPSVPLPWAPFAENVLSDQLLSVLQGHLRECRATVQRMIVLARHTVVLLYHPAGCSAVLSLPVGWCRGEERTRAFLCFGCALLFSFVLATSG